MKRLMSLLLMLSLLLTFAGCGKSAEPNNAETSAQTKPLQIQTEAEADSAQTMVLGDTAELDFAKISFSDAVLTYSVTGKGTLVTAPDGMRLFCLAGTIENTGNAPMQAENIAGEMAFNGQYTYEARAYLLNRKEIPASLAALMKEEYWLCAEIPENLIDQIETCQVRFSLNKDFASTPASAQKGDYCFEISLDQTECQAALETVATAFFEECPILPTPENYCPVYKTGSSSSSFNGKVSSISYSYSQAPGRSDDMKEVYRVYADNLEKTGFTLQNSTDAGGDIYANGIKLASVIVSGSSIRFEIVPGNENAEAPMEGKAVEGPKEEPSLKIGDSIETDKYVMTLAYQDSGLEIRSASDQYGRYTYYTSDNGDPYVYVGGVFQNLGGKPINIRNIYVQFCFDGKYNYRGHVDGNSGGNSQFVHDVAPLAKLDYVMYAAVPQELLDSYEICQIKIGFTDNFDTISVDTNDLPLFKYCDDVFQLELEAK